MLGMPSLFRYVGERFVGEKMFLAKDKKLQEKFREGVKEAMEVVYRQYSPGVTRFLRQGFTFRSGTSHCYFKGIKICQKLKIIRFSPVRI